MKAAFLPDRGVVKVSGEDARNFLNGLVTTDVTLVRPGPRPLRRAADAAGQDHVDFLITEAPAGHGGGFLLDCPRALAQGARRQARLLQAARQGRGRKPVRQPRRDRGLGRRARRSSPIWPSPIRAATRSAGGFWSPEELAQKVADLIGAELVDSAAYDAHRIASACRAAGSTSCMATRFRTKPTWTGCTASISTRAAMSARKWCRGCSIAAPRGPERSASLLDGSAPEAGHGDARRRQAGRHHGLDRRIGDGLALIRIDRVADALAAGLPLTSGGLAHPPRRSRRPRDPRRSRPSHEPVRAPACRRPDAVPVAGRRPVLHGLSRHRMGRAGI